MGGKKRCDFCYKIKPGNFHICEKILNREMEEVLVNVGGMKVTKDQLANILICYECCIALLNAEVMVLKARPLLERLNKHKLKKKPGSDATNGDITGYQSLLEADLMPGNDDSQVEEEDMNIAVAPTPQKVIARRKSVAKKMVDSIIDNELEGNPSASSTLAISTIGIGKKSTPKATPKKQTKTSAIPKSTKKPKKVVKSKFNGSSQEELTEKQLLQVQSKEPENSKEEANQSLNVSQKKDENVQITLTSPKNTSKRSISEQLNPQDEIIKSTTPFKKMKEGGPSVTAINHSQESRKNTSFIQECLECGKSFVHKDRYEAHVLSQKCRLAEYACQHPDCSRRFFKLQKMLEHMNRKHPDILQTEPMDV